MSDSVVQPRMSTTVCLMTPCDHSVLRASYEAGDREIDFYIELDLYGCLMTWDDSWSLAVTRGFYRPFPLIIPRLHRRLSHANKPQNIMRASGIALWHQ